MTQEPGQEPERPGWQPPTPPPMPPPPEYGGGPGYAGGPGYGGFQPPGPPPGPPPDVPSTLDTAWWLVVANAALSLVGLVYTVTHRDELIDRIMAARNIDPELARTAANVGIGIGVVFGLGFALFYVFLAVKMRAGRNWARVTLTVFLGLGIVGGLTNLAGNSPPFAKLIGGISLLIDVAALILIWLRPSNEYIAAHNRRW